MENTENITMKKRINKAANLIDIESDLADMPKEQSDYVSKSMAIANYISIKELHSALKETMAAIEKAFGSSAFVQSSKYQAINNKVKNWYFNATEALEKHKLK